MLLLTMLISICADAMPEQSTELTTGGQFMDLLLPMEGSVAATAGDWGTTAGENTETKYAGTWVGTLGRWKDNGIEDATHSYWGGNIIKGDDGKFHIYVSGWSSVDFGHMAWSSASRVYHIKSNNVWGPYEFVSDIGPGHNSEIYKTGDTYVIYHIEPLGIYTSTTLGDSWTSGEFLYDKRDRILIAGENTETSLSNCSFAKREDGSFVMIDRGGGIWVSHDGLTDPWHQLTDKSVYLNDEIKNRGYLEDPVIWRDHLQYHMIVNDWNARYAYYYRSLDGLHWTKEAGKAYCAEDNFAKHSNGDVERWHKYERPRVYQDEQGRAIRMNFAVIDCVKQSDLKNDTHSSKNINMPLTKQLLLEVQNVNSTSATVLVKAEDGFNPKTDLNFSSLKFGSHDKVNYGNGFSYNSHTDSGDDVIITFTGSDSGINAGEWAPKMLGQKNDGSIAFGYAKMPDVDYKPAMISAVTPVIAADGTVQTISVTNYGQSTSLATTVRVYNQAGTTLLAHGTTSALAAYANETVTLTKDNTAAVGYKSIQVRFYNGETLLNTENIPLTAINAAQAALQVVIDEANTLYNDASLTSGKTALKTAIDNAKDVVACYNISSLESEQSTLATAMNTFKYANASLTRGMSITIPNGTCDDLNEWTMTRKDADNAPGWKLNTSNRYGFDGSFIETYKAGGLKVDNKAYQTLTEMPAGRYRLRVKVIATNNGNAATDVKVYASGSTLTGSPVNQAVSTGSSACTEYMLELTLTDKGPIEFGIDFPNTTNATWVCFDTWTLKYFGTAEGEIVEEGVEEEVFDDPTDEHRSAANSSLTTATVYRIFYTRNNVRYFLKTDGTLVANQDQAGLFTFTNNPHNSGSAYDTGWYVANGSSKFTNPNTGTAGGNISANSTIRTDASHNRVNEEQVFFLQRGYYAIRCSNASGTNWGANSFWTVDSHTTPTKAIYDTTQGIAHFIWEIEPEQLSFDADKTYKLQLYSNDQYVSSTAAANDQLQVTSTAVDVAEFIIKPDGTNTNHFHLFDTKSGKYVTPSVNTSNNTAWTLSATPATVKLVDYTYSYNANHNKAEDFGSDHVYLLNNKLSDSRNYSAYANKVGNGVVLGNANPSYTSSLWKIVETGKSSDIDLSTLSSSISLSDYMTAASTMDVTYKYTATVTSAGFGTLVVPFEADVEGDVEAWELTSVDGNSSIQGTKVTTIEANKPVLLKNEGTLTLTAKSGTAAYDASPVNGLLHGTYTQSTVSAGNYVLQNLNDVVAFYKVVDSDKPTINPFRAYLSTSVSNPARMLTLSFDDITDINGVEEKKVNDRGEYFDLVGRRVARPTKGLYIVNGKKVFIN